MATETTKKSSDFFSKEFLAEMKLLLEQELTLTTEELQKFTHPSTNDPDGREADFPNHGSEEDDDVKEVEAFIVNKPLEIVLEKKIRDINKALERLTNNTYGICKFTEAPIDERRLRARPTSSSSVEAKKLLTNEA